MTTVEDVQDPASFKSRISAFPPSTVVAISFHTPWAAPCAQMSLILKTLASSYPPQTPPVISFLSLDAEALPDISESYEVTAVPFLVLQRDGKVLETVSGSDASKVREAVERHAGKAGNSAGSNLPPALETKQRDLDSTQSNGPTNDLSKYAPNGNDTRTAPDITSTQESTEDLNKRLAGLVKAAPVMLFMKGTPSAPQCGFSRKMVNILREKGIRYGFFNILADEEVRSGLKVFSDWPTFPQLYTNGELVGGLEIVQEELENNPDFFANYVAAPRGLGGMAAPEAQTQPASATV